MSLQVNGLKTVQRILRNIRSKGRVGLSRGIRAALIFFKARISPYPPAPPGSTYQRGTDPRSEQMSKQWDFEGRSLKQSLVNRASYSGRVHGRRQPLFHKQTGWRTVEQSLQDDSTEAVRFIATEYVKEIRTQ